MTLRRSHGTNSRRANSRAGPAILAPQAGLSWSEESPLDNDIVTFEAEGSPNFIAVIAVIAGSISLGGCAGAPSYELFGAYFPAWMLCALIGIVGGIVARAAFVAIGIDGILRFRLFVSISAGLVVGTFAWLVWFGQ